MTTIHTAWARVLSVALLLLAGLPVSARAQAPAPAGAADAVLAVGGAVPHALTLSAADLKAMSRTTVTVSEQGRDVRYDGVLVGEVLRRAGAPLGRDLTGDAVATYALAAAKDGYRVVFSLAELDPAFTSNDIIIADTVDGKPLFDYQGPFRLVAPHDKRGARSVRMLQRLDIVRIPK